MKKPKKIYLAIPYSKIDKELSYKIANEITVFLLKKGFNVFSPITHAHPLTKYGLKGDFDFWETMDKQFIDWSDEIITIILPENGWQLINDSIGVTEEIKYGIKTGKKHSFFDYKTKSFVNSELFEV